jgi:hypothetical protein
VRTEPLVGKLDLNGLTGSLELNLRRHRLVSPELLTYGIQKCPVFPQGVSRMA